MDIDCIMQSIGVSVRQDPDLRVVHNPPDDRDTLSYSIPHRKKKKKHLSQWNWKVCYHHLHDQMSVTDPIDTDSLDVQIVSG